MAQIIEPGQSPPPTRGMPKHEYPWNEWLDGKHRILRRGEDFVIKPRSIRSYVYAEAANRGLDVECRLGEDFITVEVLGTR